jgi:hypothetical protein
MSCPSPVRAGEAASARWTASDGLSGLAGAGEGTIPLDSGHAGSFSVSHAVVDRVGHATTLTCEYRVDEPAAPSAVPEPEATAVPEPEPTASPGPEATAVPEPEPTAVAAPQPTATAIPIPAGRPTVRLEPRGRKPVTSDGALRLAVSCSGADCDGVLSIARARTAAVRRDRRAAFHLAAGSRTTVALRLTRSERREYARRGRLAVRVAVRLAGAALRETHRIVVTTT